VLVTLIPALFVVSLILALVKKSRGWAISAGVAGVLLLGLVTLVVVGIAGVRQAARTANEPQTVTASEGRAVLDIPGAWRSLDLDNEDAALTVGNPLREEYLIVIAEPISDFELDLDGFTELALGQTLGALDSAQPGAIEALTIQGFPARRTEITGSSDGLRMHYLVTYVQGAAHYYQVLAWTLPSKRAVAFPRFEQVVGTFREQ
jgi:hypothetical protein